MQIGEAYTLIVERMIAKYGIPAPEHAKSFAAEVAVEMSECDACGRECSSDEVASMWTQHGEGQFCNVCRFPQA